MELEQAMLAELSANPQSESTRTTTDLITSLGAGLAIPAPSDEGTAATDGTAAAGAADPNAAARWQALGDLKDAAGNIYDAVGFSADESVSGDTSVLSTRQLVTDLGRFGAELNKVIELSPGPLTEPEKALLVEALQIADQEITFGAEQLINLAQQNSINVANASPTTESASVDTLELASQVLGVVTTVAGLRSSAVGFATSPTAAGALGLAGAISGTAKLADGTTPSPLFQSEEATSADLVEDQIQLSFGEGFDEQAGALANGLAAIPSFLEANGLTGEVPDFSRTVRGLHSTVSNVVFEVRSARHIADIVRYEPARNEFTREDVQALAPQIFALEGLGWEVSITTDPNSPFAEQFDPASVSLFRPTTLGVAEDTVGDWGPGLHTGAPGRDQYVSTLKNSISETYARGGDPEFSAAQLFENFKGGYHPGLDDTLVS